MSGFFSGLRAVETNARRTRAAADTAGLAPAVESGRGPALWGRPKKAPARVAHRSIQIYDTTSCARCSAPLADVAPGERPLCLYCRLIWAGEFPRGQSELRR